MTRVLAPIPDRLLELLADDAVGQLCWTERAELERLLAANRHVDPDCMHSAAASVDLACIGASVPPPPAVLRSLYSISEAWVSVPASPPVEAVSGLPHHGNGRAHGQASASTVARLEEARSQAATIAANPIWRILPWAVAAACLGLAAVVGWPRPGAASPSPAEQLAQLTSSGHALLTTNWTVTEDPASFGAAGRVVWCQGLQRGFMVLSGLAANDPATSQYQLWIFDASRPESTPVDGGVFDFPANCTELIVPIDAKLSVGTPTLFAITVEPPGGVVVSRRERIVLVAKPS